MGWWAMARARYSKAVDIRDRIQAVFYLLFGPLVAVNAAYQILAQVISRLNTGKWHFESFADTLRYTALGVRVHDLPWPFHFPIAPLYLVIGSLLSWMGYSALTGKTEETHLNE